MENFFSTLGGMGTMATESFVRLVSHRVKVIKNQKYLNYVLFSHATAPDRTAYTLDRPEENPVPFLLDDIEKQNLLRPNFIVLTCNAAHYSFEELQAATDIPILHMSRETASELVCQHTTGRIAILGTEGGMKAGIYKHEAKNFGFETMIPDTTLQEKVNCLIYHETKESDHLNQELYYEILEEVIEWLNCGKVILDHTELSLMREFTEDNHYPVIGVQPILADRTIKCALAERNEALDIVFEK